MNNWGPITPLPPSSRKNGWVKSLKLFVGHLRISQNAPQWHSWQTRAAGFPVQASRPVTLTTLSAPGLYQFRLVWRFIWHSWSLTLKSVEHPVRATMLRWGGVTRKGAVYITPGRLPSRSEVLPLSSLWLFLIWYHEKMSYQSESYRCEFTMVCLLS